jgi:hypothetical protein
MKSKMGKQEESAAGADKAVKNIKSNIDNMSRLIENSKNVAELTGASENGKAGCKRHERYSERGNEGDKNRSNTCE